MSEGRGGGFRALFSVEVGIVVVFVFDGFLADEEGGTFSFVLFFFAEYGLMTGMEATLVLAGGLFAVAAVLIGFAIDAVSFVTAT
jgi:hypothetical protein